MSGFWPDGDVGLDEAAIDRIELWHRVLETLRDPHDANWDAVTFPDYSIDGVALTEAQVAMMRRTSIEEQAAAGGLYRLQDELDAALVERARKALELHKLLRRAVPHMAGQPLGQRVMAVADGDDRLLAIRLWIECFVAWM